MYQTIKMGVCKLKAKIKVLVVFGAFLAACVFVIWTGYVLFAGAADTATLSLPGISVSAGTDFDMPVSFTVGPASVSAISFEIILPSGVSYNSISTGSSALAAEKSAQANSLAGGIVRIIIVGFNQNAISSGNLANLKLFVAGNATSGNFKLAINNLIFADPNANHVPSLGIDGMITINSGIPTPTATSTLTPTAIPTQTPYFTPFPKTGAVCSLFWGEPRQNETGLRKVGNQANVIVILTGFVPGTTVRLKNSNGANSIIGGPMAVNPYGNYFLFDSTLVDARYTPGLYFSTIISQNDEVLSFCDNGFRIVTDFLTSSPTPSQTPTATPSFIPTPPIPTPTNFGYLVCAPAFQSISASVPVTFVGSGAGGYLWRADGANPSTSSGPLFTTVFYNSGFKIVNVNANGQTAGCTVNVTENYQYIPSPTPFPATTPWMSNPYSDSQSILCGPLFQTINAGQTTFFSASGGNGQYSWQASSGNPNSGSGSSFFTNFTSPGFKVVSLSDSSGQTVGCTVNVE